MGGGGDATRHHEKGRRESGTCATFPAAQHRRNQIFEKGKKKDMGTSQSQTKNVVLSRWRSVKKLLGEKKGLSFSG